MAVGVLSLVLTINAVRPIASALVSLPSFFGGWIATELAVHRLAIQVVAIVAFPLLGGLHGWPGLAGLACLLASIAGTVVVIGLARGAGAVCEEALRQALGEDYMSRIDSDLAARYDPSIPWRRLLVPFRDG